MLKIYTAQLVPLFILNMNGSGGFIDEGTLAFVIIYIILVHLFAIVAYVARLNWLRYACALLYLPVFGIPILLSMFKMALTVLFIPPVLFYIFFILKKRK